MVRQRWRKDIPTRLPCQRSDHHPPSSRSWLSHDIGLMQINNWWLKHLRISPEVALEPRNNAMLGVWILANEIRRHGYNWTAVGAYHSPTPARQRMYAQVVARKYKNIR